MKKYYLLLLIIAGMFSINNQAYGQAKYVAIGDTNVYLPGHYLELGINNVGAFGATAPPATWGYHPYPSGPLAEVFDYGHDGWTTGTPAYYGDYTYPGSPFEGWELQINGTNRTQAFTNGTSPTLTGSPAAVLSGHSGLYVNSGGILSSTWSGFGAVGSVLSIKQTTAMDTNGSQVIITTVFKNTSATSIPAIYYMRSCDPDNDEAHGGSFATDNTIVHQNEDASHSVEVDAKGALYNDHWSLCTKDCRAVAFIYESWPLSSSINLASVWGRTYSSGTQYTLRGTLDGDYAIGLVFKIGTLGPHDSTVISYAYVFNDTFSNISTAFPDPQLVVNSAPIADSIDTVYTCSYPGLTILPVSIAHATTGVWTYSKWSWAPTTGLADSTGVNNFVTIGALSGPTTYTITGTDSAIGSCARETFLLTIYPCFSASNNGPVCQGDTLKLYAHGYSDTSSIEWYSPSGVPISTVPNLIILNATPADSGRYMVVETSGAGGHDTAYTDVVIKPAPLTTITTNAPICSGSNLTLSASVDSASETFSWTGPNGFTSSSASTGITRVPVMDSGTYKVSTSLNGCFSSDSVHVVIDSTPAVPVATSNAPVCSDSTLNLFGTDSTRGVTYSWAGPGGYVSSLQNPTIPNVPASDSSTFTLTVTLGMCKDSSTLFVPIYPTPPLPTLTQNGPLCSGNTLVLTARYTSYPDAAGVTYSWVGPNGFTSTLENPRIDSVTTLANGFYTVVASYNGCPALPETIGVPVDSTPAPLVVSSNAPICQFQTLDLYASSSTLGVLYSWTGGGTFTSTAQNPVITDAPAMTAAHFHVSATIGSCSTGADLFITVDSIPVLLYPLSSNSPICSGNTLTLSSYFTPMTLGSTITWTGPGGYTSSSLDPSIFSAPTTASGVYSVTETLDICTSAVYTIAVTVNSTPDAPLVSSNTPVCEGHVLQFTATDDSAGVTWNWSGPSGFSSSLQDPSITNVALADSGIYTLVVSLGSGTTACTATASTYVSITPTPFFIPTSNSPVCSGDTLFLYANGDSGSQYFWSGPYAYFAYDSTISSTRDIPNVLTENAGVYTVTALLNGCTTIEMDTVVVNQTPAPPFVTWLTYCQNYPAPPLMANDSSLVWYPADTMAGGSSTPPIPSTAVVGTTVYYAAQVIKGCSSTIDSIEVKVNPKPTVTVSNDTAVCPNSTIMLTATDTDAIANYRWYPSIYLNDTNTATVTVNPETNVTYAVIASNQYGCADTASVHVVVYPAAVINIADSVTLYPGESYTITAATNCTYFSWFPAAGLSNTAIANPVADPSLSTKYIVSGQTENGCSTTDSINVNVSAASIMDIPNAFTPGNGPNHEFKIIKKGIVSLSYFRIFDRWGQKVFETSNIDAGWDGTLSGTPQPFGVYIYEIEAVASNGQHFIKQGNVTLIR